LPEKYRKWGKNLGIKTPPDEYCQEQEFSISNPKDGVTYYRLSNLSPEFQSIKFELKRSNMEGKIEWILNGIQLQTTSKEHSFLWQVKPGSYKLKAISEDDNNLFDSVEFIVK